ncbi:MAG: hypothetical protein K8R59_17445 [Thermoanaerobaculales bacterium]|nr:hypothetical protein [Thermoanaerobaculales bacterium]
MSRLPIVDLRPLPGLFADLMDNVVIQIEDEPDKAVSGLLHLLWTG